MNRLSLLGIIILCSCGLRSSPLVWTSPGENTTLVGESTLTVEGANDTLTSVTFYAGDTLLGEAEASGDTFSLGFNAPEYPEGKLLLRAVPNTGAPSSLGVQIAHSGSGTVNTPGQPQDDPGASAVGEDPLNLGGLEGLVSGIDENPLGEAIANFPPGFPVASLMKRQLLVQKVHSLLPMQAAEPVLLPVGIYTFNPDTETWEVEEAPFDAAQINFSYVDAEGQSHDITATAWWDRYAETQMAQQSGVEVEVPTQMWFSVTDNDEEILNVDLSTQWLEPEGCAAPMLVPETLELDGWVNKERPLDSYDPPEGVPLPGDLFPTQEGGEEGSADEVIKHILLGTGLQFSVTYEQTGADEALDAEFYLDAVTDQDLQVSTYWLLESEGQLEIEDCNVTGGTLDMFNLYASLLYGPESEAFNGPVLNFNLSDLTYNEQGIPTSARLGSVLNVLASEDPAQTTYIEGDLSLDDEGFTADGTVTLPDTSTLTLMAYLEQLWAYYSGAATEAANP